MDQMNEECFVLLKPDCVQRHLIGKILSRIEDTELIVTKIKMLKATSELISQHYPDDSSWLKNVGLKSIKKSQSMGISVTQTSLSIGQKVRKDLIRYFSEKTVVAITVNGSNSIACMRKLAGKTEPLSALPGTIRGDFSLSTQSNIVHASDSIEAAKEEVFRFFNEDELFEYKKVDELPRIKKAFIGSGIRYDLLTKSYNKNEN